ncbi:hypothetical protein NUSPORA_02457 [Nucleospora cyclopteri]
MYNEQLDRQIRLFGLNTQNKLAKCTVTVTGKGNLITAEILKNVILLGVKEVRTTREIIVEAEKMIRGAVDELNREVKITVFKQKAIENILNIEHNRVGAVTKVMNSLLKTSNLFCRREKIDNKYNFAFIVDEKCKEYADFYYICSECECLIKNQFKHVDCLAKAQKKGKEMRQEKEINVCKNHLLGAMAVQEYIKIVEGKETHTEFLCLKDI